MPQGQSDRISESQELDPGAGSHRSSPGSIARFIGRGISVLVGLAVAWFGVAFYILRCFSTCPSDPAENAISQILSLSLVGFGLIVSIAALTLGTKLAAAGRWLIIGIGTSIAGGGLVSVALAPSLQVAANGAETVAFGIIDTAAGIGCVLLASRVRRRSNG